MSDKPTRREAFDAMLAAAHMHYAATGEIPIVLNVELYEFFDQWVKVVEVNVLRGGDIGEVVVEGRFAERKRIDVEELELRAMR